MDSLNLTERIDQHFPQPKSNRGYQPSEFIKALILMQHEGSFHLDDIRHIRDDEALCTVLELEKLPRRLPWETGSGEQEASPKARRPGWR
ncbi:hypothetical protein ULF88_19585 [Halopseudomonas pachastrellae]|nr:hypothetical protein [Halopseudomonas pachastrellae]MEB3735615.1 hypothetical protein [Halopseudomonas pachastrellae]